MAANLTAIGPTTRVRGRVSGSGDLDISGFVEGEIAMGGDVTVLPSGMVGASIRGRRLVVRGAVRGDLVGEESVILEDGARVVGDVQAPRVAVAQGALLRGHVQTADEDMLPATTSRAQASSKLGLSAPRVATVQAKPAVAAAMPARPARPLTASTSAASVVPRAAPSPQQGTARRPPPPVVPALKKVRGQLLKKKER